MNEKDMFLQLKEREFQTTMKVLRAYPSDKLEFKPHDRSRTAGSLAIGFSYEEMAGRMALEGDVDFSKMPRMEQPKTMVEIMAICEKVHKETVEQIQAATEEQLNRKVKFAGMEVRAMDVLWSMMFDSIHHRGQFSVYIRLAGGKVPAIYGPSADEPWDPK